MAVLMLMLALLALQCQGINSLPEQGVFTAVLNKDNGYMVGIHKSMYNGSLIAVKLECHSEGAGNQFKMKWLVRMTTCAQEFVGVEDIRERLSMYLESPNYDQVDLGYKMVSYKSNTDETKHACNDHPIFLQDESDKDVTKIAAIPSKGNFTNKAPVQQTSNDNQNKNESEQPAIKRRKRQASDTPTAKPRTSTLVTIKPTTNAVVKQTTTSSPPLKVKKPLDEIEHDTVTKTWEDGIYLFILQAEVINQDVNLTATVWMTGTYGYLSAIDWPLLPFYGVMCVIYLVYGIVWLVLSFCNWRDLLRIQFWIGGVIFLGMLEKAVFFAEYEKINSTGQSVRGAVVFAELVSCMKRTVARMLVVIVSLGFGIVKPRLGPMLHRVLGMGALYMILGSVEGVLRVTKHKSDTSRQALLASIPLAVLDAAICWWVFTSLVQTTRTLRLRRNLVKLSLYRHFTNTLIFAVLASVAFMIWSIKQHKMVTCLSDWKEIWVDEAFWHLLFSVILLVIMVLWRPTANNQRYAFSPLLDAADDEAEEPMLSDAFDGMKMRGTGKQGGTSPKPRGDAKSKADEDLKWIEENIPTSVTDTALPSLLDSDEEIMTTKFEMSKME